MAAGNLLALGSWSGGADVVTAGARGWSWVVGLW
jgi:hypothetical protein